MMMLKGRLPAITRKRLLFVGAAVLFAAVVILALTPARGEMPLWVHRLRIPLWFAHYWALGIPPVWVFLTWLVFRHPAWMKNFPPASAEIRVYPHRPDLSTRELWDQEKRKEHYLVPSSQERG